MALAAAALHLYAILGQQHQPALPELADPADQPLVTHDTDDPLIKVSHPRIVTLETYRRAGYRGAVTSTMMRSTAATRLYEAADSLPERFGIAVFDAWRPLELQRAIYEEAYRDPKMSAGFVSIPSDNPQTPPPHLTGGAADVTLTFDKMPLLLGTRFDDFTPAAHTDAFETFRGPVRELRRLLFWTMHHAGFVNLDFEWWHYEYGTRRWAALTDSTPLYGPATFE